MFRVFLDSQYFQPLLQPQQGSDDGAITEADDQAVSFAASTFEIFQSCVSAAASANFELDTVPSELDPQGEEAALQLASAVAKLNRAPLFGVCTEREK